MKFIELENYRDLYNDEALFNLIGRAMFAPTINKVKNAVEGIYNKQQGHVFYCEKDEEKVGLLGLKRVDNTFEIMHLSVLESEETKGIGAFMLKEIMKYPGIIEIYLETDDDAVSFYRKQGFKCRKIVDQNVEFDRFICRKKV